MAPRSAPLFPASSQPPAPGLAGRVEASCPAMGPSYTHTHPLTHKLSHTCTHTCEQPPHLLTQLGTCTQVRHTHPCTQTHPHLLPPPACTHPHAHHPPPHHSDRVSCRLPGKDAACRVQAAAGRRGRWGWESPAGSGDCVPASPCGADRPTPGARRRGGGMLGLAGIQF